MAAEEEMTKTEQGRERRRKEAEQRAADRKSRLQRANKRQRDADVATYGEGSMLLESKKGNIYDVETGQYDPPFNKEGTDETIGNDGIDNFDQEEGGIPDGYEERQVTLCEDGSPIGGKILFKKD
jgi:hypothetical protein|tara:strand:+ start:1609 stop:1983 length:375 start_codon:yes stop_codon:yes gene_type:complete